MRLHFSSMATVAPMSEHAAAPAENVGEPAPVAPTSDPAPTQSTVPDQNVNRSGESQAANDSSVEANKVEPKQDDAKPSDLATAEPNKEESKPTVDKPAEHTEPNTEDVKPTSNPSIEPTNGASEPEEKESKPTVEHKQTDGHDATTKHDGVEVKETSTGDATMEPAETNPKQTSDKPQTSSEPSGNDPKKETNQQPETSSNVTPADKPADAQDTTTKNHADTEETHQPATTKQTDGPAEKRVEPKPQDNQAEDSAAFQHMTRAQFLASMGLTQDDVTDPGTRAERLPVRGVDLDDAIDENFIRNTDLSDSLFAAAKASPTAESEYRKTQLEKYRTTVSATSSGDAESPLRHRAEAEARNDAAAARDYRVRMLEEFRNRKSCGTSKSPPRASPRRAPASEA
jgi:hypothetical protein